MGRRVDLARMVSGLVIPPHAPELLARAIDEYPLQAVCVEATAVDEAGLREALERSPLQLVRRIHHYEIWARVATGGNP